MRSETSNQHMRTRTRQAKRMHRKGKNELVFGKYVELFRKTDFTTIEYMNYAGSFESSNVDRIAELLFSETGRKEPMETAKTPPKAYWAVICFILLIFVPNYAQFQLSPIAHLVIPQYHTDTVGFSMLFSAPMIFGFLLSLVAGLLCDKFGVKRVVGIAAIVSTVALIGRIVATDFNTLFVRRSCRRKGC